jgi:putative endonuclease
VVPEETTTARGRRYEALALAHLEARGLRLLARNFRCKGGEIDLVMQDGAVLALVEVRMRGRADFGGAAASVDARKRARLITAARVLLRTRPELARLPARFDVVAIDGADQAAAVEWIRDAFRLG